MVRRALAWLLGTAGVFFLLALLVWHPTPQGKRNERQISKAITALGHAQQAYKSVHGTYGTLKQLAEANPDGPLAACRTGQCSGYEISMRLADENSEAAYVVEAYPIEYGESGFLCFLLDHLGNRFVGVPRDGSKRSERGASCRCGYRPSLGSNHRFPGRIVDPELDSVDWEVVRYCEDDVIQRAAPPTASGNSAPR